MSWADLAVIAVVLLVIAVVWRYLYLRPRTAPVPTTPTPYRSVEHAILAKREIALIHGKPLAEAIEALARDRGTRWKARMAGTPISRRIQHWAESMADSYGPVVRVGFQETDWLTALMIVRYGEAEDFWPKEFSLTDERRAAAWKAGEVPRRVTYLVNLTLEEESLQ